MPELCRWGGLERPPYSFAESGRRGGPGRPAAEPAISLDYGSSGTAQPLAGSSLLVE